MENSSLSNQYLFMSFDQLLDSLGYSQWITVTATFILPSISFISLLLCVISSVIFFQSKYTAEYLFSKIFRFKSKSGYLGFHIKCIREAAQKKKRKAFQFKFVFVAECSEKIITT